GAADTRCDGRIGCVAFSSLGRLAAQGRGEAVTFFAFFLLPGAGRLRDLHSFPTRRSSDLSSTVRSWTFAGGSGFAATSFARGSTDRKSTRLNSSHLGISYAVFCLKKKNAPPCGALHERPSGGRLRAPHRSSLLIATSQFSR